MTLKAQEIDYWAKFVGRASQQRREIERITALTPLSLNDGYKIQDRGIELALERGEKAIGFKMGITSRAKMKQFGIEVPVYGVLTSTMELKEDEAYRPYDFIHPRVEPEIVFRLKNDLRGNPTREEAIEACDWVSGGLEIIDSRFQNYKFEIPDLAADNCSASRFILGSIRKNPRDIKLGELRMTIEAPAQPAHEGLSSGILDHPADSLVALARILHERGRHIPAGSIVLSGSPVPTLPLQAGVRVMATFDEFGTISLDPVPS